MKAEEKRQFYRPFRCAGGFMLFIGIISIVLTLLVTPLTLLMASVIKNEPIYTEIVSFVTFSVTVYSYYLAYRIFIKQYDIPLFIKDRVSRKDVLPAMLALIPAFCLIRVTWYYYSLLLIRLNLLGSLPAATDVTWSELLYAVILAPLCEETVFRGWLLKLLKRYGALAAAILTAVCFGVFHGTLLQIPPAIICGLVFAWLTFRFRSIIPAIVLHFLTNGMSCLPVDEEPIMHIYLIVAGIGILLFLITNCRKLLRHARETGLIFKLSIHSISYILFILMYLGITISTVLAG